MEYGLLNEYGLFAARIHLLIDDIDRSLRDPTLLFFFGSAIGALILRRTSSLTIDSPLLIR